MDIINFIMYGLFFTAGFLSADIITRKRSLQFFIEIQTKTKEYRARIHHIYLSIASILTYFFDMYALTSLFAGIGLHDAILELKKRLRKGSEK